MASVIWQRFGNVSNFVDPFMGSLAVLLARPGEPGTETVNDANAYLSNAWRAIQQAPEETAAWADDIVSEVDLHARHRWLIARAAELKEQMIADPDYFDAKVAGYWLWGQCCWIGSGWCVTPHSKLPELGSGRGVCRPSLQLPHLADGGPGLHRKIPQLDSVGGGDGIHRGSLHRRRPHLGGVGGGDGVHRASLHKPSLKVPHLDPGGRGALLAEHHSSGLVAYFQSLARRLRRVRICCGDWTRVLGTTPTIKHGLTGVFLDPPYGAERTEGLYAEDSMAVAAEVREWALAHGDVPLLRIALAGYEGEHDMPETWQVYRWKAHGGYGAQGNGLGRENARRECLWFSPHCLKNTLPLEWD